MQIKTKTAGFSLTRTFQNFLKTETFDSEFKKRLKPALTNTFFEILRGPTNEQYVLQGYNEVGQFTDSFFNTLTEEHKRDQDVPK